LFDFEKHIGYLPDHHEFKRFNANTAITNHAKRTFALIEADFPYEIKVEKDAKEFDIKSIGYDDFDGQLEHHVSAHPKVDRKTGHFMAFAYDRFIPFVNCSYFDKNRNLVSYTKIPVDSCRMLHDFVNTEHYIIIPDLPMEANPKNCLNGKWFYQLNKDKLARYGILKRGDTNGKDNTKWFELPSHYCFHFANAWEETNEKGEELVVIWGCRADDLDAEFSVEHPFLASKYKTKTTRFEFNL
jgi:carotenoid cleavage dioxygenase-like enzyme